MDVFQDPAFLWEEALVGKEVAFNARKRDGEVDFIELGRPRFRPPQRDRVTLPLAPGGRGLGLNLTVGVGQAPMIGPDHVPLLSDRNGGQKPFPCVREHHAGPVLVEPGQFLLGQ